MSYTYPLDWPQDVERWPSRTQNRELTRSMERSVGDLLLQLRHYGAENVRITTNLQVDRDGKPWTRQPSPKDPAVALYYTLDGNERRLLCDRWATVGQNLNAISLTIVGLRRMKDWGTQS